MTHSSWAFRDSPPPLTADKDRFCFGREQSPDREPQAVVRILPSHHPLTWTKDTPKIGPRITEVTERRTARKQKR